MTEGEYLNIHLQEVIDDAIKNHMFYSAEIAQRMIDNKEFAIQILILISMLCEKNNSLYIILGKSVLFSEIKHD